MELKVLLRSFILLGRGQMVARLTQAKPFPAAPTRHLIQSPPRTALHIRMRASVVDIAPCGDNWSFFCSPFFDPLTPWARDCLPPTNNNRESRNYSSRAKLFDHFKLLQLFSGPNYSKKKVEAKRRSLLLLVNSFALANPQYAKWGSWGYSAAIGSFKVKCTGTVDQ